MGLLAGKYWKKFGFQNWRLKRREEKEDRFLGDVEKGCECLGRRKM
ncbi:hypothetical protein NC653_034448 [Populus alba x Populus x berolinensis]|uniref:Uncharacterized protein n=1 Tax=Populus alba x Populus x berolinensis TaxID=444605 RepID=A0AAD6PW25_9ROSI|nr:hypothetical protein NC653_034448 [Populus alba x Populus x berolinensis]